jgi:hypothetical protein
MTNRQKPVSWMGQQARHDQALQAPEPDKIADRTTLEASLRAKTGLRWNHRHPHHSIQLPRQ